MVAMAVAGIQNTRILRFLIVLGAVVVTIFIYASYSTNPSMTTPLRMRNSEYAALHVQQQPQQNSKDKSILITNAIVPPPAALGTLASVANTDVGGGSTVSKEHIKKVVAISEQKKIRHHHYREPTIDKDADGETTNGDDAASAAAGSGALDLTVGNGLEDVPDDIMLERLEHNGLMDEQYGQLDSDISSDKINGSMTVGNIATQTRSQAFVDNEANGVNEQQQQQQRNDIESDSKTNINKIPDSDVLIPTSNLQKFIENADKILKNITSDNNKTTDKETLLTETDERKITIEFPQPAKAPAIEGQMGKADAPLAGANGDGEVNNIGIINSPQTGIETNQVIKTSAASATTTNQGATNSNAKTTSIIKNSSSATKVMYTSKGIPTESIYEHGHLDDEIDIEQLCPKQGADLKLLILITSAQDHMLARLAIRQTWGHYNMRRDVATAFVLGRTLNDTINKALTQENHIYGDLIRGNFIDSYNNLTLKTISSLEWVDRHCTQAKYVLKTDDDMFINVPKLLAFIDSHAKEKRVIFGRLAKKWKPVRNKKSKYYVSPEQFSAAVFPSFTTGPAYLLTGDIVHELYVRSLQIVYLKLEDVFTTGIVSQQLDVRRLHANEFLNRRIAFNPCNVRKAISIHMIKANEQFDLWKKLLDQTAKCK